MKKYPQLLKSISLGLGILLALVVYAYGFKVTKVNLEETRSERRQTQLVRILRALAKPELVTYQQKEFTVDLQYLIPCPAGGYTPPTADKSLPYIEISPSCGEPGQEVIIKGYNFQPNSSGPLNFIPPSTVKLPLGTIDADANGEFTMTAKLPNRPDETVQHIRALTRMTVGLPAISQTALDTWEKILETVFLALLATTLGTALAVPLSFFAAKNLMKDVRTPVLAAALNILLIPIGVYVGALCASWLQKLTPQIAPTPLINLVEMVVLMAAAYFGIKWAMPPEDEPGVKLGLKIARIAVMVLAAAASVSALFMLSSLLIMVGDFLTVRLGVFSFLGTFVADLGDILGMTLAVIVALAVAGIFGSLAGRLGKIISRSVKPATQKILNVVGTAAAGAALFMLIIGGLHLIYQFENFGTLMLWAGGLGALLGGLLAFFKKTTDDLPVGLVIYYLARTIFNALRSIEALIMVIVFVVWVGIGPFAGVLALSLHTIAALAKLYSEQVESIMEGPLEAVTATGANQLQTIVYAVIPQIIPPYISFTMYRWDINVRMSTIIGFAGGGGIGFLLIQNINLLNYRAASVQMIAIALVVASMDYLSSRLRENVI
ncbi:MAG: ABC transporter permease subunit [Anaerolineaceae bacterium]